MPLKKRLKHIFFWISSDSILLYNKFGLIVDINIRCNFTSDVFFRIYPDNDSNTGTCILQYALLPLIPIACKNELKVILLVTIVCSELASEVNADT